MNNNFYDDILNIVKLIKEMNRITNLKYVEKVGDYAPLIYMHGKCYYFARGLASIIPDSTLYISSSPLHVITKVNDLYYDALGMIYPYLCKSYIPIDLNCDLDMDYINTTVANEYDDEFLLPIMLEIGKAADENVRLEVESRENINKEKNGCRVRERRCQE